MTVRSVLAAAVAGALLLIGGCRDAAVTPANTASTESADAAIPLEIRTATGLVSLRVDVARTAEEQAQGLMYRTELADDEGLLFPYDPPRQASFWMESTAIPLDLIFIRADGSVESIIENTVPYSREPLLSGEPVAAVLEIAGGRAAALGIAPGDRVGWPGGPRLNPGGSSR